MYICVSCVCKHVGFVNVCISVDIRVSICEAMTMFIYIYMYIVVECVRSFVNVCMFNDVYVYAYVSVYVSIFVSAFECLCVCVYEMDLCVYVRIVYKCKCVFFYKYLTLYVFNRFYLRLYVTASV